MSNNIVEFRPREKSRHEKLSELLGSSNYLTLHFTDAGALSYTFGDRMTDEQLSYICKIIEIITVETIKSNICVIPHGQDL